MAFIFYNMMKEIAEEIDKLTGALTISHDFSPTVLDMCMAPGGFLATVLAKNPGAFARGLSLPVSKGGHKVLLPDDLNIEAEFLDITMLAADMGVTDIPVAHPDASNMLPQRFDPFELFDLVLCDGQVLRTHARAAYREPREARRLSVTQLAMGLEHVKSGAMVERAVEDCYFWNRCRICRRARYGEFAYRDSVGRVWRSADRTGSGGMEDTGECFEESAVYQEVTG